jgi:hypothetical protein
MTFNSLFGSSVRVASAVCAATALLGIAAFSAQKADGKKRMSVDEIRTEFQEYKRQFPGKSILFESFAAQMDVLDGADKRFEAYRATPELYPIMPLAWVEGEFRQFKKANRDSKLTIAEFGWQSDCLEGGSRRREAYRTRFAALVVLHGFMGIDRAPMAEVYVVEKRAGSISIILRSGKSITHSGQYSIID